jgi:hypothetical protein
MSGRPPGAEQRVEQHRILLRRLVSLPEEPMRAAALASVLEGLDPAVGADLMDLLLSRAHLTEPPWRLANDALMRMVLERKLSYQRVQTIYAEAHEQGFEAVKDLLRTPREIAPPVSEDDPSPDPLLSALTLGERKWKARGQSVDLLNRLATDRDPSVIRNLLRNPRLTEDQVLRIAARRPTEPAVLVEVFHNRRWSRRYRVRKALAFNPHTPVVLSKQLVAGLRRADLLDLARSGAVPKEVRDEAMAQLGQRRPLPRGYKDDE